MRYKLFLFLAFLAVQQLHAATPETLPIPKDGTIHVAFVLENGATMIDFAGPWEVFQDVMLTPEGKGMRKMSDDMKMPFQLFTVAETKEPRRVSGGMKIVPDYTYDDAPAANVIVIPAQGSSARRRAWLQEMSKKADVVFSVCTGAFVVADAGLLDGKKATTHHWFQDRFHEKFPQIEL